MGPLDQTAITDLGDQLAVQSLPDVVRFATGPASHGTTQGASEGAIRKVPGPASITLSLKGLRRLCNCHVRRALGRTQ